MFGSLASEPVFLVTLVHDGFGLPEHPSGKVCLYIRAFGVQPRLGALGSLSLGGALPRQLCEKSLPQRGVALLGEGRPQPEKTSQENVYSWRVLPKNAR